MCIRDSFNTNNLSNFDSAFRHSAFTRLVDETDDAITSNITTVELSKDFTPTLGTATKYTVPFSNALYNPHSGHMASAGGILTSSGFRIDGNTNECFFDDDGAGNVRLYYLSGGVKTYLNSTQGTVDYSTGAITVSYTHLTLPTSDLV